MRLKIFLFVVPLLLIIQPICYGIEKTDKESLSQFIEGTYSVIGKMPGSTETYYGAVKIIQSKKGFAVLRCVKGKRLTGSAEIVEVTADKIPSSQVFLQRGKERIRRPL